MEDSESQSYPFFPRYEIGSVRNEFFHEYGNLNNFLNKNFLLGKTDFYFFAHHFFTLLIARHWIGTDFATLLIAIKKEGMMPNLNSMGRSDKDSSVLATAISTGIIIAITSVFLLGVLTL